MAGSVPVGYVDDAGLAYSGGYGELIDALLEYVPDMLWPMSIRTFARMRTDPQIGGVLKAYTLPIRRAPWVVDGAGCDPKVTAFIADELGLPVLGTDPTPTGARRRKITWGKHIRLALLDLVFGHMPFERTYDYDEAAGLLHLGMLEERMPQTIGQILVSASGGQLDGIVQNALAGANTPHKIPAEALVWYAHEHEGSNWTGRSLLRAAYAPWLLKHELWRVHATSIRRFGMGVPSVEAPPGASPQQVAEAGRLAMSMRGGDQAGAGLPPGFKLALTGITGSVPDAIGFIAYLDQQMTRNTLTSVLDLGTTKTGSRALGETFLDMFLLALQTIADDHADQATSQIVVPLVDLNWGEDTPAPRIVCGDVASDRAVTAETLKALSDAGALDFDPSLKEWIRREYKLPAPTEPPAPVTASGRQRRALAAGNAPALAAGNAPALRREPTQVEAASKADFTAIQDDWVSALETLATQWSSITEVQRDALVAAVEQAVQDGDIGSLADITLDNQDAAEQLLEAMTSAANDAMNQATKEANAQGADVQSDPTVNTDRLSGIATALAATLGSGLVSLGIRTALQNWSPDATPKGVSKAVKDAIDSLTGTALKDSLGAALSAAQNEGRVAAFAAAPEATYYASEILDNASCSACTDIDNHQYDTLEDALADYANGGYVGCLGGLRCRGIIVAVWE